MNYPNEDNIYEMFKCDDGSKCYKMNDPGYYINSMSEKKDELIYCDSNNQCQISIQSDGYFINSSDENYYIKCHNSICNEIYEKESSCTTKPNEIIYYNDNFYFCLNDKRIIFYNQIKYYKLSNIKANEIFPKIVKGDDYILLKVDQYSITQYSSNSGGNIKIYMIN